MIKVNPLGLACALLCLTTPTLRAQVAPDPPGGYWSTDILATADPTAPGVVTYRVDAQRVRNSEEKAHAWSNGISYEFGGDRTAEGVSGYSSCYMTQVVGAGPVDHVVIRLNPFSSSGKVCYDPRFDPRTLATPSKVLRFYIKVPSGWHYVAASAVVMGPWPPATYAQATADPPIVPPIPPFASPPVYAPLADAVSPNMLTLSLTCDSAFPPPPYGVYDDPQYSATFQLAPDAPKVARPKQGFNSANSESSARIKPLVITKIDTAYLEHREFKPAPSAARKGNP